MIVNLKYNCNPYGNHKVATRKPLVDTRKRKEPTYYCRKSSNHKRREPEKREQRNYRTVRNSSQNGNTYILINKYFENNELNSPEYREAEWIKKHDTSMYTAYKKLTSNLKTD